MTPYFVLKTFRHWLKLNSGRFHHPPHIFHVRRNGFAIRFSGVSPHIGGFIAKEGSAAISVDYRGRCWDFLCDFDVVPVRAPEGGYFCKLCETPKLFPSRQDLLIEHSWEPLLEWVNAKLTATTWVCLYGGESCGFTEARLKQQHEVVQERASESHFLITFPALGTSARYSRK